MNIRSMSRVIALLLGGLLILGAACSTSSSNPTSDDPYSDPDPTTESLAYKLAVIGGDASDEAAFQDVIDCIMASGIEGAETEEQVGDTLYASWEQSVASPTRSSSGLRRSARPEPSAKRRVCSDDLRDGQCRRARGYCRGRSGPAPDASGDEVRFRLFRFRRRFSHPITLAIPLVRDLRSCSKHTV